MLKFINLKKLTIYSLIAVLTTLTLASQPTTANNGRGSGGGNPHTSSDSSCNSNNGQGNNAPIELTLYTGKTITVTRFDPSNPGGGDYITRRINDANASLTPAEFLDAQSQLQQLINDVELNGSSSGSSNCPETNNDSNEDDNLDSAENVDNNSDTENEDNVEASEDNSIKVTIEAPRIQTSQLPNSDEYFVIDFDDQRTGTAGFSKSNGTTIYEYTSNLEIKNANQWGGAGGSKFITQESIQSIRSYTIKINEDQKYFGFWWSAGDPYNQITFKNDGREVAVFRTEDLVDFINSSGVDDTDAYYGNPSYSGNQRDHRNEPFSFVNVFFNNQAYDEIVVATLTEGGAAFESDNHTFSPLTQAVRGEELPETIEVEEPETGGGTNPEDETGGGTNPEDETGGGTNPEDETGGDNNGGGNNGGDNNGGDNNGDGNDFDKNGIKDQFETEGDLDEDGVDDYQDPDDDGDGIPDVMELYRSSEIDFDDVNNVIVYKRDEDGNLERDDNGELIPITISLPKAPVNNLQLEDALNSYPDTDADYQNPDSDGDYISDADEAGNNGDLTIPPVNSDADHPTNSDTLPDYLDLDSDGDYISDADEAGDADLDSDPVNSDEDHSTNSDTLPDYLDLDSDGDYISDADEAGDTDLTTSPRNTDGLDDGADYLDLDSDEDTISDADEAGDDNLDSDPVNSDKDYSGDNLPDYIDLDSDNNGILDEQEILDTNQDIDGDKTPNFQDLDDDGDKIIDVIEIGGGATPLNSDNDATDGYDYQDSDSDNDRIPDDKEGVVSSSTSATPVNVNYSGVNEITSHSLQDSDANNTKKDGASCIEEGVSSCGITISPIIITNDDGTIYEDGTVEIQNTITGLDYQVKNIAD